MAATLLPGTHERIQDDIARDMGRPKKPPTEPVRMRRDLAKHIRLVASALDMSIPEYLDSRLRALVKKDMKQVRRQFDDIGLDAK